MNGIEKITGRIEADVNREIEEINTQAQAQAQAILDQYEAQAKAESEEILARGRQAAAERLERLGSVAKLEARKRTLAVKQDLVGQSFHMALERLLALPDEEYVELLAQLAAKAAQSGREQILLSKKDRARFGKQVVTRANEILARAAAPELPRELTESKAGAFLDKVVVGASALLAGTGMLTLSEETRPIRGGVILEENRVEINCSLESLVRFQREPMEIQVAQLLFGVQE